MGIKETRLTDAVLDAISRALHYTTAGDVADGFADDVQEAFEDAIAWVAAIRVQRASDKHVREAAARLRGKR